jgi:hypothetical protein
MTSVAEGRKFGRKTQKGPKRIQFGGGILTRIMKKGTVGAEFLYDLVFHKIMQISF